MIFPANEVPHNTPEEARLAALANCVKNYGNNCEAREGVAFCQECPKKDEGLKRRRKRIEKEEAGTIKEIPFGQDYWDKDGQKRVRLMGEDGHFRLQFGIRYKDNPEMFVTAQQLVIHPDAVMPIKEILGLVR